MSYLQYIISLLFSLLFYSSCSRLPATDREQEIPAMTFSLICNSFSGMTEKHGADFREIDSEIDRMDIAVFYRKQGSTTCLFQKLHEGISFSKKGSILTAAIENPLSGQVEVSSGDALVCFFIANGKGLSYPEFLQTGSATLEEFKKTLFGWKEQPAEGPLVMTGIAEVKVEHLLSTSVPSVPISLVLERRVARIDLVNQTSGYEMKDIYLKNIRNVTTLSDVAGMWENTPPVDTQSVEAFSSAYHSFYVFPCENSNNIQIVVEGIYEGRSLTLSAPFANSRRLMDIEPNTIYKVVISNSDTRAQGSCPLKVSLQVIENK